MLVPVGPVAVYWHHQMFQDTFLASIEGARLTWNVTQLQSARHN